MNRKPRTFKSLAASALQLPDGDARWQLVMEMQARAGSAALEAVAGLCRSRNWRKRALGLDVASQLYERDERAAGGSRGEYAPQETRALLLAGLQDAHPQVQRCAAYGLGHRGHPGALPALVHLAGHADADMRHAVAFALTGYPGPEATQALLALAADGDDDVRDWATFALGSMREDDSPQLRARLHENLHDANPDVRGEALVGLAQRKDESILPVLLERLDEDCKVYELDAAELMASPVLLDRLQQILAQVGEGGDGWWHARLRDAIRACGPPRPRADASDAGSG